MRMGRGYEVQVTYRIANAETLAEALTVLDLPNTLVGGTFGAEDLLPHPEVPGVHVVRATGLQYIVRGTEDA